PGAPAVHIRIGAAGERKLARQLELLLRVLRGVDRLDLDPRVGLSPAFGGGHVTIVEARARIGSCSQSLPPPRPPSPAGPSRAWGRSTSPAEEPFTSSISRPVETASCASLRLLRAKPPPLSLSTVAGLRTFAHPASARMRSRRSGSPIAGLVRRMRCSRRR